MLAHPMESPRRTTLRRQQRLAALLLERDNASLAPYERAALLERIRSEISVDWQTEEHPRERLTVADEREHAIFYLSEILYRIVPAFYQEIATALSKLYGVPSARPRAAGDRALRQLGRRGHGLFRATCTPRASARPWRARSRSSFSSITRNVGELAQMLSQSASRVGISTRPSCAASRSIARCCPATQALTPSRHDRMPYRVLLTQIAERLHATYDGRSSGYQHPSQFRADVALIAQSLLANRGAHAGYFSVRRLLSRIDTFGFHLATLDLRAHTTVHHAVLAQGLDDPRVDRAVPRPSGTRGWSRCSRRDTGPSGSFDALGKRTLAVFDAIVQSRHRYGADAIGLYIVERRGAGRRCAGAAGTGTLGRGL